MPIRPYPTPGGEQPRRYIPARPTVYNGVRMRSRLEASFARWLDSWPSVHWQYEPEAFASEAATYLPDFLAEGFRCSWADGPQRVYFEVKPSIFGWQDEWNHDLGPIEGPQAAAAAQEEDLYRSMAVIWTADPIGLLVVARQRPAGGADFTALFDHQEYGPGAEPVELVAGDIAGRTPAFAPVAAPAEPPWPHNYWKFGL